MINRQQIYQWWDVFKHGTELTEIRIIDGSRTYSGYFKDVERLISAIEPFDSLPNAQIYFTLNHINPACFGRAQHEKIILVKREPTTGDSDIDGRTHVLIDIDPKRPAGVSASDEELKYAHATVGKVYHFLIRQGFSEPIVCKSGNGYHIVLPCQIAATEERTSVIKRFLQVLSLIFSDEHVDIDEKVYNAARICKLYGVTAKKGENIPERPWRQSEIVSVPHDVKVTDVAYFEKVAALYPEEEVRPTRSNGYSTERFDLVAFLDKHGLGYRTERVSGGTKYILDHCPFNHQHTHKDAVIFQRDNGAIGFICLHNSCSQYTWKDVRLMFEPDAYDRKDYYEHRGKRAYSVPLEPQPIVEDKDKGKIWLKLGDVNKPPFDYRDFIPSGIGELDRRVVGFRRGHVSVWTGKRGCGKSSMLNMLILNAAQNGFKSALWTGELTADIVKEWITLQAAGKSYTEQLHGLDFYTVKEHVLPKICEWLDKYLWVFNNRYGDDINRLIEQIRKLHEKEGIDVVLLDNLMVLDIRSLDEDKYDRQGILLQKLEDLAKELKIHIHLVAHPHKSLGYIQVDNISGSGDISNKADNIFIMSRVNNDFHKSAPDYIDRMTLSDIDGSGCTNVVEVGKFRVKGTVVGEIIKFWFEPESNRLKNSVAENITYGWAENPEQETLEYDEGEPFGAPIDEYPF